MTELEKAEHDVQHAKRAANVADWKALEAKAVYTRKVAESYEAEAELQAARIRLADAERAALSVPEVAEVEIPEGFTRWESGYCPFDIGTHLEVFTRKNGVWPVVIKPEAPLLWEHEGHDLDIIAYRVLPIEPAAAKGETFANQGQPVCWNQNDLR